MTLPPDAAPPESAAAAAAARDHAMRYYRIWIYACNGALLLGALAFCAAAARALADYRRGLVPGLGAAQPGFLYGYAALPAQAGLLQLLGCLAALRLSERLLHAYWLALLALLLGDAAVGVFWAFRFERVCRELRPALRVRLARDYDSDLEFAEAWDRLQREQHCCGVAGPTDFAAFNRSAWPASCCRVASSTLTSTTALPVLPVAAESLVSTIAPVSTMAPASSLAPATAQSSPTPAAPITSTKSPVSAAPSSPTTPALPLHTAAPHCAPYTTACADRLLGWLRRTADALFVLGYCVIAFLKLCFLGILRYEIKEMIQKIRILRKELEAGDGEEGSPLHGGGPLSQTVILNAVNANGGVRARAGSPERAGERDALLGRPGEIGSRRGTREDLSSAKNMNANNCELRELARGDYRPLAERDSAATRI